MTLEEARASIGQRVEYRACGDCEEPEAGVITSVGERFAFVRYDDALHSKATGPERLSLLAGEG